MIKLRERESFCPRWRSLLVYWSCLAGCMVLLSGAMLRYTYQGEMLLKRFDGIYKDKVVVPGDRGAIWDRNGRPLAMSVDEYKAHVNPRKFREWEAKKRPEDAQRYREEVVELVGIAPDKLEQILARDKGFAYLKKELSPTVVQRARRMDLPHLAFERFSERFWPMRQNAAHIVGYTNADGTGKGGVESARDNMLAPVYGEQDVIKTNKGMVLEQLHNTPAVNGEDVFLTIDSRLQYFATSALLKQLEHHEARSGSLVLMDVRTGDILAIASVPSFNPNKIDGALPGHAAIQDIFEPGSTTKAIAAAIAMEEGVVEPDTVLDTAKPIRFGRGQHVTDPKYEPNRTLAETIMVSSNVGMARVVERLEDEALWEGFKRFGYGDSRQIGLPGETPGKLHSPENWSRNGFEKATMSFGYGLSANLLQLSRAFAVFGNYGMLPSPGIYLDEQRAKPTRAISPQTAANSIRMLESVTSDEGTGHRARIPGYRVAGKTGTVFKSNPEGGGYNRKLRQSLFVGLAPVSAPRFVCAVMFDEPTKNGYGGGVVAAPVFREVMSHALRMYGVAPDNVVQKMYMAALGAAESGEEG